MATYPINNKKDLINAIKEMSDADKKKAGISGGSDDPTGENALEKKRKAQLEYNKVLRATAEEFGNIKAAREADVEVIEKQLLLSGDFDQQMIERIKNGEITSDQLEGEHAKYKDIAESLRQQTLILKAHNKYGEDQRKILGGVASAIGINMKFQDSFLGSIIKTSKAMQDGSEEGHKYAQVFIDNFKEIFSLQNILYSTIMKVAEASIKVATDFDEARSKVAAATGAGHLFAESMFEAQREANLFGVTMADTGEAIAALTEGTSNFAKMNVDAQKQMTITTAKLKKIGVDGATAAETFQFLNVNLGMTAKQATDAQKKLAMMGTNLGISAAKITKDFNASLSTLAVYGDDAVDVFSNLAGAAKAAGVETSKLLDLAGKFDTFQGAAETVGKMNALLGTQMSTTQMLMMTEDERIETLISQVQAQGVAFKDMDRFTQKAIASAAGIQDINEAQRIFGMNLDDYKKNQEEMAKNEEVQQKFNDAVDATVPIMQKFKLLATEIIVTVQPILEKLGAAAEFLTEKLRDTSTETKQFYGNLVMVVGGGYLLIKTGKSLYKGLKALAAIKTTLTAVTTTLATAQTVETTTAAPAAAATHMFAGSMKALGKAMPYVLIGLAAVTVAVVAITGAFAVYENQKARVAEAEAKEAEANFKMAQSYGDLAKTMSALSSVNFSTVNAQVREMVQELAKIGANGEVMIKTRATVENLALISVGRAKDSMTGDVVTAGGITANIENVFKDMKMVVEIGGEKFDAYVKDIAADVATQ